MRCAMTSAERVALLEEAAAIERAGGDWRLRHAAVVAGYSESFLRRSDCPRHYDIDTKTPFLKPSEVREWKANRLVTAAERFGRPA
jgi:hypothetical protein